MLKKLLIFFTIFFIIVVFISIISDSINIQKEPKTLYNNINDFAGYKKNKLVYEYTDKSYIISYFFNGLYLYSYDFIKHKNKWEDILDTGKINFNGKYIFHLPIPEKNINNISSAYLINDNKNIQPIAKELIYCNDSKYLISIFEIDIKDYGIYEYKFLDNEGNVLDYIFTKGFGNFGEPVMDLFVDDGDYKYDFEYSSDTGRQLVDIIINTYNKREHIEIDEIIINSKWEITYTGYNQLIIIDENHGRFSMQNVKLTMKWISENKYLCVEEIYNGDEVIEKNNYECEMDLDHSEIEKLFKDIKEQKNVN